MDPDHAHGAAWARALPRGLGRTRLAPVLLPVAYRALIVTAVLIGLAAIAAAALTAWWLGVLAALAVPPLVLGAIVLARVGAELALAVLAMSDDVAEIAAGLPRLESTMDDVASDMPRIGFLRRGR
jgi:hypothetical protein